MNFRYLVSTFFVPKPLKRREEIDEWENFFIYGVGSDEWDETRNSTSFRQRKKNNDEFHFCEGDEDRYCLLEVFLCKMKLSSFVMFRNKKNIYFKNRRGRGCVFHWLQKASSFENCSKLTILKICNLILAIIFHSP